MNIHSALLLLSTDGQQKPSTVSRATSSEPPDPAARTAEGDYSAETSEKASAHP